MKQKLTYQEIHDTLYDEEELEINEVVLEDNELASVEIISGQSQNKNEQEISRGNQMRDFLNSSRTSAGARILVGCGSG